MSDLETFNPEPRSITVGGREFHLTPLKLRKISAFTKAVLPVGHLLVSGNIGAALVLGYAGLCTAAALALDVAEDWIDDLPGPEFTALFAALISVNADFFVPLLLSLLPPAPVKGTTQAPAGGESSRPSAPSVIAETTSSI